MLRKIFCWMSLVHSKSTWDDIFFSFNKWSCERCTYLNWSHANQCIQCETPRSGLASFLHERLQPLRISEQNEAASVHGRTPSPPLAIIESDRDGMQQIFLHIVGKMWIMHVERKHGTNAGIYKFSVKVWQMLIFTCKLLTFQDQ